MPNGMAASLTFAQVDRYSDDFAAFCAKSPNYRQMVIKVEARQRSKSLLPDHSAAAIKPSRAMSRLA
jgi:hypothetical protein